jgi:hypothetical protein
MIKLSILVSVLGGALAGAIFKRVWKAAAGEDEAPKATDGARGWREVLVAPLCRALSSPWSRRLWTAAQRRAPAS